MSKVFKPWIHYATGGDFVFPLSGKDAFEQINISFSLISKNQYYSNPVADGGTVQGQGNFDYKAFVSFQFNTLSATQFIDRIESLRTALAGDPLNDGYFTFYIHSDDVSDYTYFSSCKLIGEIKIDDAVVENPLKPGTRAKCSFEFIADGLVTDATSEVIDSEVEVTDLILSATNSIIYKNASTDEVLMKIDMATSTIYMKKPFKIVTTIA